MSAPSFSADSFILGNQLITVSGNALYVNNNSQTGTAGILNTGVVNLIGAQLINGEKRFNSFISGAGITGGSEFGISFVSENERISSGSSTLINIRAKTLNSAGTSSVNWNNRILVDNGASTALNWQNKQLSGDWTINSLPSNSGHLVNKGYLDLKTGSILDTAVRTTGNQLIYGSKIFTGSVILQSIMDDYFGSTVLRADLRSLYSNGDVSIDWANKYLYESVDGDITLNWNLQQLSGNWSTNTMPVNSGHLINKGFLTGKFITGCPPPSNTVTPVTWGFISINGSGLKIPFYQ